MAAKRKPDIEELWAQILGLPLEQRQQLLQRVNRSLPNSQEEAAASHAIWDEILSLSESISDEDSAKLPHDGSVHYKHYLYGLPKED